MHRPIPFLFLLSVSILAGSVNTGATTLVSENFNDHSYSSPLTYFNVTGYDQNMVYDSANARGGAGYCLKFDHSSNITGGNGPAYAGIGMLSDPGKYLTDGVYIRYWIKYSSGYLFPLEVGTNDNLKILKLGGGSGDLEWINKNTNGGPSSSHFFYLNNDGGTSVFYPSFGFTETKGQWHKIEIYLKIPATSNSSCVDLSIDDHEIYNNNCTGNVLQPASAYNTLQFMSLRAQFVDPGDDHGFYYTDDVTIVAGEGDLSNHEPAELSGSASPPPALTSPAITNIQIK